MSQTENTRKLKQKQSFKKAQSTFVHNFAQLLEQENRKEGSGSLVRNLDDTPNVIPEILPANMAKVRDMGSTPQPNVNVKMKLNDTDELV